MNMASPPRLKRKQQPSQPCGQGGVFGLSPLESAPRDSRKRRKDKHTWIKHTLTPYFDGHLWRKYGQKVIKDAPYPRLYFRCSYREDRRCLASKLVQQVNHDDPPLYEVTYTYEHTCNAAPVPAPDVEAGDDRPASGGLVLSFGSSSGADRHHHDTRVPKQEWQQYHQSPSPFLTMNLDYSNGSHQHAFPSSVPPPTTSWSLSFPIVEFSSASPTPWTDDDDDILTWDWDLSAYDLDDHFQLGDHVQFSGSPFSWKPDGNALANLGMGN
ncbi:unnamed protein product [Urochloa decumbens]|uniref:WRKY domain-containing protein n=1 Tax=Urochloa decumbens TaxID=240449 RepID=A0ABC9F4L3_9POAL